MKKEINERDINVLMEDRYTRKEAIAALELGTMVYENIEDLAVDFDATVEEIRAGECEDLKSVMHDGHEYGVAVAH